MPKLGMEPIRRAALIHATIAEVGDAGSLDVSVSRIAKRAGMSSALAHHYFGGKEQIFLAAMRQILRDFRVEVVQELQKADSPRARAGAIISASFAPSCFAPGTVTAWMTFYAMAQSHPEALRLLRLYQRRLRGNLIHALRPLTTDAEDKADMIGAMIDGAYLRAAVARQQTGDEARVHRALDILLGGHHDQT